MAEKDPIGFQQEVEAFYQKLYDIKKEIQTGIEELIQVIQNIPGKIVRK